jgi:hypothetical protein
MDHEVITVTMKPTLSMRSCSIVLIGLIVGGSACTDAGSRAAPTRAEPYPNGPYWFEPSRLDSVFVDGRHILVAHAGSTSPTGRAARHVSVRPSSRSYADALAKAFELHDRLRDAPSQFAEVARDHSDEEDAHRDEGRLGIVPASELPPALVNGFAHIEVGSVSRVFESAMGLHILQRLEVPPASIAQTATTSFGPLESWTYETAIERLSAPRLALFIRQFGRDAASELRRTPGAAVIETLTESLAAAVFEASLEDRLGIIMRAEQEARAALGEEGYQRLLDFRARWFERMTQLPPPGGL